MSTIQEKSPCVTWQVAAGCEEPQLDQWLASPTARVIKHGAHRTVYRVDLPDRTLYVKHYRCQPWFGVWRHLLRASQSRREWRKTWEVARRRIPTASPIAMGEVLQGPLVRDNYYVSEGIAGAQSLDEYIHNSLPCLPARERRQMIVAVARLAAEAHSQGIDHNDFHTGNLLIRWPVNDRESQPELYLIDLPGVRLRGALNWRRSRDSLAMLGGGWLLRLSRADRGRFWRSYLAARPEASGFFPTDAAEQIVQRMWRHARAIAAMRDKRPLRTNRDFQRMKTAQGNAHSVIELLPEQLQALTAEPAQPLSTYRHAPVKISHASLLVEAQLPLGETAIAVAYKRSRTNSWWKRLLSPLRRSRAIAAWHTGHALLARGIATARPLAAIQPRAYAGESYLATAWLQGALNLHLYGWELADCEPRERHRRACLAAESLGRLLGRMHAWHVSHRDLKGCNLVVRERAGQTEAYLIDLEGVRFTGGLSDARRVRDLARLAASMEAHPWLTSAVRLRFLRAYLRQLPSVRPRWKPLWRQVAREAGRFLDDFQRQGRPVA